MTRAVPSIEVGTTSSGDIVSHDLNKSDGTFSINVTARDAFAEERITYRGESSSCTNRSNLDNSDGTHTRPVDNLTGLIGVVWPVPAVVATHSLIDDRRRIYQSA